MRWDLAIDRFIFDRLGDAAVFGLCQTCNVDGQDNISRRIGPFGLDTLHKALVEEKNIGLDARFFRKAIQQRLDQFRLTEGVDIDLAVGECGAGTQHNCRHREAENVFLHGGVSPDPVHMYNVERHIQNFF